jgi:hypothetical protein
VSSSPAFLNHLQSLEDTKRVYKRKETRTEPEPFKFVPGRKRAPIVYIEVILSKSRYASASEFLPYPLSFSLPICWLLSVAHSLNLE